MKKRYKMAADSGILRAQFLTGVYYQNGKGVKKDEKMRLSILIWQLSGVMVTHFMKFEIFYGNQN